MGSDRSCSARALARISRLIRLQVGENPAVRQGAVTRDVEHAYVAGAAVGYVELLLVGRERYAIRAVAIAAGDAQVAFAGDLIYQRFAGRASEQVDDYLGGTIYPLLQQGEDLEPVDAEVQV